MVTRQFVTERRHRRQPARQTAFSFAALAPACGCGMIWVVSGAFWRWRQRGCSFTRHHARALGCREKTRTCCHAAENAHERRPLQTRSARTARRICALRDVLRARRNHAATACMPSALARVSAGLWRVVHGESSGCGYSHLLLRCLITCCAVTGCFLVAGEGMKTRTEQANSSLSYAVWLQQVGGHGAIAACYKLATPQHCPTAACHFLLPYILTVLSLADMAWLCQLGIALICLYMWPWYLVISRRARQATSLLWALGRAIIGKTMICGITWAAVAAARHPPLICHARTPWCSQERATRH